MNKKKYDFICSLLTEGDAMICLDARKDGVVVPPEHRKNHSLNLILNLNFKRPLEVEEEGVYATLAFNGRPFRCVAPNEAIWAAFNPQTGKGQIWGESVPAEVLKKMGQPEPHREQEPDFSQPTEQTKLKAAPPNKQAHGQGFKLPRPKALRSKAHLRVVK